MKYATIVFKRHDEAYQARINIIDLTTGIDVIRDKIVDTYIKYCDYTNGVFEFLNFTYPLIHETHQYQTSVFNYGAVAGRTYGSGTPIGDVEIDSMRITSDLEPARPLATLLLLWQNERPHLYQFSNINMNTKTEITKQQEFLADDITKIFTLNDENTASDFHSFSDDGGLTWKSPFDLGIVWGSNYPDYDNQLVSSEGHFSVKFFTEPLENSVIIIRYFPMSNRARLYTIFNLSHDDMFVDFKVPSRLTNMAIELFK